MLFSPPVELDVKGTVESVMAKDGNMVLAFFSCVGVGRAEGYIPERYRPVETVFKHNLTVYPDGTVKVGRGGQYAVSWYV